jgi:hypothetical protein
MDRWGLQGRLGSQHALAFPKGLAWKQAGPYPRDRQSGRQRRAALGFHTRAHAPVSPPRNPPPPTAHDSRQQTHTHPPTHPPIYSPQVINGGVDTVLAGCVRPKVVFPPIVERGGPELGASLGASGRGPHGAGQVGLGRCLHAALSDCDKALLAVNPLLRPKPSWEPSGGVSWVRGGSKLFWGPP